MMMVMTYDGLHESGVLEIQDVCFLTIYMSMKEAVVSNPIFVIKKT